MVDPGFEQLDFNEYKLIIEALELFEQTVDEREGIVVGGFGHVEGNEASLEVLAEEASSFGGGPFNARLCDGNLGVGGIGNAMKEIEKLADCGKKCQYSFLR
jgi:hypothetical protein